MARSEPSEAAPQLVCEYCGLPIDEPEQECLARSGEVCAP